MSKTNKAQIVIGLAVLLLGTAVYFLDRPWEQTIFVPGALSLFPLTSSVFGVIGHSLPTFAHVFAFSLLTIALVGGAKRAAITVCLGWFLVDATFEMGQHPQVAGWLSNLVPQWFEHLPVLDRTADYFVYGTFDPLDLLSVAFGALVAYLVIRRTQRRGVIELLKQHGAKK